MFLRRKVYHKSIFTVAYITQKAQNQIQDKCRKSLLKINKKIFVKKQIIAHLDITCTRFLGSKTFLAKKKQNPLNTYQNGD